MNEVLDHAILWLASSLPSCQYCDMRIIQLATSLVNCHMSNIVYPSVDLHPSQLVYPKVGLQPIQKEMSFIKLVSSRVERFKFVCNIRKWEHCYQLATGWRPTGSETLSGTVSSTEGGT